MAQLKDLRVGQRVKFLNASRSAEFTGTITAISEEAGVTVKTEAANGSIAHLESTHAHEVTVLGEENRGTKEKEKEIQQGSATSGIGSGAAPTTKGSIIR